MMARPRTNVNFPGWNGPSGPPAPPVTLPTTTLPSSTHPSAPPTAPPGVSPGVYWFHTHEAHQFHPVHLLPYHPTPALHGTRLLDAATFAGTRSAA